MAEPKPDRLLAITDAIISNADGDPALLDELNEMAGEADGDGGGELDADADDDSAPADEKAKERVADWIAKEAKRRLGERKQ